MVLPILSRAGASSAFAAAAESCAEAQIGVSLAKCCDWPLD